MALLGARYLLSPRSAASWSGSDDSQPQPEIRSGTDVASPATSEKKPPVLDA